ncbi:MAG TPA: SDR family oxidoreductase [Gemmatimonadaceae bacterium]|nr:SDR family oxidoreductase [Gemmatimonadaceae bacterium]
MSKLAAVHDALHAPPSRPLAGQVAVVTGASRGLGRAYAEAFASAGAAVALVARGAADLDAVAAELSAAGGRVLPVAVDVTDADAVRRAAEQIVDALGPVDLLVNAAGIGMPMGPFASASIEQWWRTIEVNVKGPALWSRVLLPAMIARGRGRIVNLASIAGGRAIPNWSAYTTSKTALIRLSESLAIEGAGAGVRVFPIHPGTVRTPMTEEALQSDEARRLVPALAAIFDRGLDTPLDDSVAFVMRLALGEADALSGRFLTVQDDLASLAELGGSAALGESLTLRVVQPVTAGV